jgi:hypothetical protein
MSSINLSRSFGAPVFWNRNPKASLRSVLGVALPALWAGNSKSYNFVRAENLLSKTCGLMPKERFGRTKIF